MTETATTEAQAPPRKVGKSFTVAQGGPNTDLPRAPARLLLGAYIDLSRTDLAPAHALGVALQGRELASGYDTARFQRYPPAAMRVRLVRECDLGDGCLGDPRELPCARRTAEWQELCDAVDGFAGLETERQSAVARLCNALGYYRCTRRLLGRPVEALLSAGGAPSDSAVRLAVHLAIAVRKTGGGVAGKHIDRFLVEIISRATPGASIPARIELLVRHVKSGRRAEVVAETDELLAAMRRVTWGEGVADRLTRSTVYRSAVHRGLILDDPAQADEFLGLAAEIANGAVPSTDVERALAWENSRALLETRTRVALWKNDIDLAVSHHTVLVGLDPLDSRRHVQLGDLLAGADPAAALTSYLTAARLGAPCTASAWTTAGEVQERLGDRLAACTAYSAALEADPYGVSSAVGLRRVARFTGQHALVRWADAHLRECSELIRTDDRRQEQ